MPNLPQQDTIVQYIASGSQTQFTFAFYAPLQTDIQVYSQPMNAYPIPADDLLGLNIDYSITYNADPTTGGFITIFVAPPQGNIITINRFVLASLNTNFALAQNINGANLDAAFDRLLLLCQQNVNYNLYRNLSYIINSYLPNAAAQTQLPELANMQIWQGTGTTVVAVTLEENPDVSTLRSQLALATPEFDGASLIGYYDVQGGEATTVADYLASLEDTQENMVIGGDMTTNPWQRGTTFNLTATQTYTADRFRWDFVGTGVVTISKATDSPTVAQSGFFGVNSLKVAVTTADTSLPNGNFYAITYKMEGYDFTKIAQQSFAVSFWVKCSLLGTYGISFSNKGSDYSFTGLYDILAVNTWQFVTVIVSASPSMGTWNYTNGTGLSVVFALSSTSQYAATNTDVWQAGLFYSTAAQTNFMATVGNTFLIDRIKIEPGIFPTAWVTRPVGEEISLCERYFQKSYLQADAPGTATQVGETYLLLGGTAAPPTGIAVQQLRTRQRAPGAVTLYSPITGDSNSIYDQGNSSGVLVTATAIGEGSFIINNLSANPIGATTPLIWQYVADAELYGTN